MKTILVETSARHIHLTTQDLAILCGADFRMEAVRPLSQPGQYVSNVRLTLFGPKKSFENVVVLGPVRPASQVEVSATEARMLGLTPPVRESGDIAGSSPITIVGPKGQIQLPQGCIIAKRHIHMTPDDAAYFGVSDKQVVSVKIPSSQRSLIFGDVIIRIRKDFALAMHIDTDEANAAGLNGETQGELIK
ncbi:MAG: phosphate propanoyltransferase [Bacilli bacterium]